MAEFNRFQCVAEPSLNRSSVICANWEISNRRSGRVLASQANLIRIERKSEKFDNGSSSSRCLT